MKSSLRKVGSFVRKDLVLLGGNGLGWSLGALAAGVALLSVGLTPQTFLCFTFFPEFAFAYQLFEIDRSREKLFVYYFRNPLYYLLSKFFLIFLYAFAVNLTAFLIASFQSAVWRGNFPILVFLLPFLSLLQATVLTVGGTVGCGAGTTTLFLVASMLLAGFSVPFMSGTLEAALRGSVKMPLSFAALVLFSTLIFFLSVSANRRHNGR